MVGLDPMYIAVVKGHLDAYIGRKKDERAAIVGLAVLDIEKMAEEKGVEPPLFAQKKVETWFQNHRPHKKKAQPKIRTVDQRIAGAWNVRKVVQQTMKPEIAQYAASKDPAALPGTSAYIIAYQKNCSDVIKSLTPAQVANCQQQADQWNSAGPDATAQALLAEDKFGTQAEQFMTHVKKQMGVHVFMFIGYKNEKGEMVRAKLETPKNHPTEPAFLKVFNKSTSGNEIWTEWDKFLEQQPTSVPQVDAVKGRAGHPDKSVPWPLPCNGDGLPILPSSDGHNLPEIKHIIRSFLSLTYRHAANNRKASVPWKLIAEDPDKFFDPKYLPGGVQLLEISKMKAEALQSCYAFWYKCQERGQEVFVFKHVHSADFRDPAQKRKRGAAAKDGDDDNDDDNDGVGYVDKKHLSFSPSPPRNTSPETDKQPSRTSQSPSPPPHNKSSTGKSNAGPIDVASDVPDDVQSQCDFLSGLSGEKEYQELLECIEAFPDVSASSSPSTSRSGPDWLSWSYSAIHLPKSFHASTGEFESFVKWLRSSPHRTSAWEPHGQAVMILMCLGVGLVLRDLDKIQFGLGEEEDSDADSDLSLQHLKNSKLTWGHTQAILGACQDIMDDVTVCFQEETELQHPGNNRVKPSSAKLLPPKGLTTRSAAAKAQAAKHDVAKPASKAVKGRKRAKR